MLFQVPSQVFFPVTPHHLYCIVFFNIFFPYNFTRVKSEGIIKIYFTLVTLVVGKIFFCIRKFDCVHICKAALDKSEKVKLFSNSY